MDILGIGGTELLVVVLLAAVILGPRRLAVTAREAGKLIRNLRSYWKALSDDLGRELDVLADLKETQADLRQIKTGLKR
jgi:sec-independent protein translocase protein TatB